MPLMREWVEIHVDENLLIHVVRELLSLAADPNQVEVTYGTAGRIVLAEVHLAEAWYQTRLAKELSQVEGVVGPEVVAPTDVESPAVALAEVERSTVAAADVRLPAPLTPSARVVASADVESSNIAPAKVAPARRAPAPKPSASPDGEEP